MKLHTSIVATILRRLVLGLAVQAAFNINEPSTATTSSGPTSVPSLDPPVPPPSPPAPTKSESGFDCYPLHTKARLQTPRAYSPPFPRIVLNL
jgi:hypothetical protein